MLNDEELLIQRSINKVLALGVQEIVGPDIFLRTLGRNPSILSHAFPHCLSVMLAYGCWSWLALIICDLH